MRIAGYNIVEATNAAEAVAVSTAGTVIDLVFSDIDFMAGPNSMDGVGLARWVSQHHPGVHVILTSGNRHAARAADVATAFLPENHTACGKAFFASARFSKTLSSATNEHRADEAKAGKRLASAVQPRAGYALAEGEALFTVASIRSKRKRLSKPEEGASYFCNQYCSFYP